MWDTSAASSTHGELSSYFPRISESVKRILVVVKVEGTKRESKQYKVNIASD